jgi:polysaccharide pyruvyl transferase WcaK-like protein
MKAAGFENVTHSSCPTTWGLKGSFVNKFNPDLKKILVMLTSYNQDEETDNRILETVLESGMNQIYFFPQSLNDTAYLMQLELYKKNRDKFILLPHELSNLIQLLSSEQINYIGSRLHGGILCMKYGQPSLILSVDNRAQEMKKSIRLNIIERKDSETLKKWMSREYIPAPVQLPLDGIELWKNQFKQNG